MLWARGRGLSARGFVVGERRREEGGRRTADVRLLCSPGVCTVMKVPLGTGIVRFSPHALVVVNAVSSALCFGMVIAGGKRRRVSLKTLRSARVRNLRDGAREGGGGGEGGKGGGEEEAYAMVYANVENSS